MTKKYVVTGATGNIGHVLTEKLLVAGHTVVAAGRNPDKLKALADKGGFNRHWRLERCFVPDRHIQRG